MFSLTNKTHVFWLFTAGVFAVIMLPEFFGIGMFFDGVVYATVARNMAQGIGDFWHPSYTGAFYGHPPLAMWMESFFFRLFGDHLFVEKLYSMLTGILAALLIAYAWIMLRRRAEYPDENSSRLAWLPVFLWMITTNIYWTYRHNMLENTLAIFCLCAVMCTVYALQNTKNTKKILWFSCASLCIILGILTKGPVALFPLAVIPLYWLVYRRISLGAMVEYTAYQIVFVIAAYALLLQHPPALDFFRTYLNEQVMGSVAGSSLADRLSDIKGLFIDNLLAMIVISVGVYTIARAKKMCFDPLTNTASHRGFWFFFLIALAASFPVMLSAKRRFYYTVPAMPYFALAFALWIEPIVRRWFERINVATRGFRVFTITAIVLLCAGLIAPLFQYNRVTRDRDLLDDLVQVKQYIPTYTAIGISNSMTEEWYLYAYFARYFHDTLQPQSENVKCLFLTKGDTPRNPRAQRVNVPTKHFDVYKEF